MNDHVYRVTEIVGSSSDGIDQAIRSALERAQHTLRNVDWFEVTEIRGDAEGRLPARRTMRKLDGAVMEAPGEGR